MTLWRDGAIVWAGSVDAHVTEVTFDTVCLRVDDSALMASRLPRQASAKEGLATLAGWWA